MDKSFCFFFQKEALASCLPKSRPMRRQQRRLVLPWR
jgi:hypothetical protein